jgi:hypothetical protein
VMNGLRYEVAKLARVLVKNLEVEDADGITRPTCLHEYLSSRARLATAVSSKLQ